MTSQSLGTFLTASEIARALGISKSGIFNLIRRGEFPAGVKIGKSRRWNMAEIQSWLEKQGTRS